MGKGFALPSSLRRLYGPLDGWSAETIAPYARLWYKESVAGKIQQPGLETRFQRRIPASHCRRFFVALCIQSIPVSIALSMGQLCGRLHACRFRWTGFPARMTAPFFIA